MHSASLLSQEQLGEIAAAASSLWERRDQGFTCEIAPGLEKRTATRLKQWQDIVAEGDLALFADRLARDGLDPHSARSILGRARLPATFDLPEWCGVLNEVLRATPALCEVAVSPGLDGKFPYLERGDPVPFEEALLPLVETACAMLGPRAGNPLPDKVMAAFARALLARLSDIAARVLAVEFRTFLATRQLAGLPYVDVGSGKISREHYLKFVAKIYRSGWAPLFQEYCVMARLLATALLHWVGMVQEFETRIASDACEIERLFNRGNPLAGVAAIEAELSDPHDGGRTVIAVEFGCGLKIVYKPKCLALEQSYFQFAAWINRFGTLLPFRVLTILDRGTYGWVEYVEHRSCASEDEIRRYYRRSGTFLCLVYALNGSDFHYENLIASGEHPVPIDLETVYHHRAGSAGMGSEAYGEIAERLRHSVLATDLLPDPVKLDHQYFDISALARSEAEEGEPEILNWKHTNTDGMDYDYARKRPEPGSNLPLLNGTTIPVDAYTQDISAGFEQAYRFLIEHREALIADHGPLRRLFACEARFIFRSTAYYALLLKKVMHPACLRDGVDFSLQLDVLAKPSLKGELKPGSWPLIQAEMTSLWQMDVPKFAIRGDDDALRLGSGSENVVLPGYFAASAWSAVRAKLGGLSEEDMRWQMSLIVGSLDVRSANLWVDASVALPIEADDATQPAETATLLQQALSIADEIESRAFRLNNGEIGWMVLNYSPAAERYTLQPMECDLYNGLAGVGLFFAALARLVPDSRYRALAHATLQPVRRWIRGASERELAEFGLGGYAGTSSVAYALTRAGVFLRETDMIEEGRVAALRIAPEQIDKDETLDAIGGSAGAILGLLASHAATADPDLLARAVACGRHLLRKREADRSGFRTWPTLGKHHMTGFSHGAAGIAYALLKLYERTNDSEFYEAAMEGIGFESNEFLPEENNWRDTRRAVAERSGVPPCAMAWCHGAPGIGLGRIGALDIMDTPDIRNDIQAALQSTGTVDLLTRDHLCCGNAGLMDTLCTAGERLSERQWTRKALQLATRTMARANGRRFSVAFANGFFNPSLFQGTAGVGYQMLRLANPDEIPSVLLLE